MIEPCTDRPTVIDLNSVELKYYPFMIGLDKCSGNCNVLFPKIYVPKKKRHVKVFNVITNKNEAAVMAKHISCDCECRFNSTTCNSNQKWNKKNVNVKIMVSVKNVIVGILARTSTCENSKY